MRCVTGSDSDSDESDKFFEASSDTNTIQVDETILYSHLIYWKQDNWQTIQGTHFPMGWVEEMSCSIVPTLLCKTGRIWGALTHRSWTPSWELTPSHVCNTREPANQFWHAFLLTSLKNDNDGYFADMWAWHVCIQNQDQFHIYQTASWNTFHHGLSLGVPISNLRSGFSSIFTIRWCIGRSQSCSKQPQSSDSVERYEENIWKLVPSIALFMLFLIRTKAWNKLWLNFLPMWSPIWSKLVEEALTWWGLQTGSDFHFQALSKVENLTKLPNFTEKDMEATSSMNLWLAEAYKEAQLGLSEGGLPIGMWSRFSLLLSTLRHAWLVNDVAKDNIWACQLEVLEINQIQIADGIPKLKTSPGSVLVDATGTVVSRGQYTMHFILDSTFSFG